MALGHAALLRKRLQLVDRPPDPAAELQDLRYKIFVSSSFTHLATMGGSIWIVIGMVQASPWQPGCGSIAVATASPKVPLMTPAADGWTPLHLSELFLKRIRKVPLQTVMLERAGHYPLEQPGLSQMVKAIDAFYRRVSEAR